MSSCFYSSNPDKAVALAKSQLKDGWLLDEVLTYFLILTDNPFLVKRLDSELATDNPEGDPEPSPDIPDPEKDLCRAQHYFEDR